MQPLQFPCGEAQRGKAWRAGEAGEFPKREWAETRGLDQG